MKAAYSFESLFYTWYHFHLGTGTLCCNTLQQYRHAMRPTAGIRYGAEAAYTPVYLPIPLFQERLNCSFVYGSTINTTIVDGWEQWGSHYYSIPATGIYSN